MWEYQTTLPVSWETCMQTKKQHLEPDMEQWTGSKLGKEYDKAVYCHSAYLNYKQRTSCEMPGLLKHKLNQDCQEMYQQPQICRWYYISDRKQRGTKEPLDEGERREWKSWLKTYQSKNSDHSIWSHHFMANVWGKNGNSVFPWAPNSLRMVTATMKLKDTCSLEEKLWPT